MDPAEITRRWTLLPGRLGACVRACMAGRDAVNHASSLALAESAALRVLRLLALLGLQYGLPAMAVWLDSPSCKHALVVETLSLCRQQRSVTRKQEGANCSTICASIIRTTGIIAQLRVNPPLLVEFVLGKGAVWSTHSSGSATVCRQSLYWKFALEIAAS
jgi:hypothetical protein